MHADFLARMQTLLTLLVFTLGAWSTTVLADTITLKDGSTIIGEMVPATNGSCTIVRSGAIAFTLNCAEIAKIAAAQPAYLPDTPTLTVAGSNTIGAKLMPALLIDYARVKGATDTPALPDVLAMDEMAILPKPAVANLWARIVVGAHGSSSGFQALAALALQRRSAANGQPAAGTAAAPLNAAENLIDPKLKSSSLWSSIEGAAGGGSADVAKPLLIQGPDHAALLAFANGQLPGDIAMASRRVSAAEITALATLGALDSPVSERVVALDGLAIVVNRANRVETLSVEQVMKIYSAKVTDWKELGGFPGKIVPYARNEISGTFDTFKNMVLKGGVMTPKVKTIEDSRELSRTVANDPNAIGFIGMSFVGEAKALNIRSCNLDYAPTSFNAKTEEYPLSRRLFLYVPAKNSKSVEDFLAYTNTARAQKIVALNNYVDLAIEPDFSGDQRRMRSLDIATHRSRHDDRYAGMLEKGGRLSVTLRFRSKSGDINRADLDNRALHDMQRIKDYMSSAEGQGRRISLVGFSDAMGDFNRNVALSLERAVGIASQLKDVPKAEVLGLGPKFPVACNDSEEGRERNRRVEVWITD